jgi:Histidine kinase-like ATPase domain
MVGMRIVPGASDSQSQSSEKPPRSSILEIDSWMPSRGNLSLVDRLMPLMEGSRCVPGEEPDVERALRAGLANAVVHANQKGQIKVHTRCRCATGNEISIIVSEQGRKFDFRNITGDSSTLEASGEHNHGIQLMKAYVDDVYFERVGQKFPGPSALETVCIRNLRSSPSSA